MNTKIAAATAAAVTAVLLLAGGCTTEPPAAAIPPRATTEATPRLMPTDIAYQKAEAAYRNAFHLMNLGTWKAPPTTTEMKKYMTGSYLSDLAATRIYTANGLGYLDGVATAGYTGTADSPTTVNLTGCEDWSSVVPFKDGKKVTPAGSRRYLQHLRVAKGSDGVWRVSDQSGTDKIAATDWENQVCSSDILDEKPTA